jgi:hypothetical protein
MRIHAYTGVEEWQYVVDVAAKLTQSGKRVVLSLQTTGTPFQPGRQRTEYMQR